MPMREQASFQETLLPPAPTILPPTAFNVEASTPSLAATRSAILSRASTPALRCDSQTLPMVVLPPEGPLAGYLDEPMLILMASIGNPNVSPSTIAQAVRVPVPKSWVPQKVSTPPSG